MDRRAKVELFERMRREYEHGEGTIRGVARRLGVHRRMVRQAIASAMPPERKRPERAWPRLGPVKEFINSILDSDRKAPRKQRHTAHRIWGRLRAESIGAAMQAEQEHLLSSPEEGFDLAEVSFPLVDSAGCVKVRTNFYSVPVKAGTRVQAKVYSAYVEVWQESACVARHERCYGRQQQVLDLEHYLEVLEKKPGALAGSKPLEQWRKAGRWPTSYDRFWEELRRRHGRQAGTRQMIVLLKLGPQQGWEKLQEAVETAVSLSCWDVAAVEYLVAAAQQERPTREALEVGWLGRYERPLPVMNEYDQLLGGEVGR